MNSFISKKTVIGREMKHFRHSCLSIKGFHSFFLLIMYYILSFYVNVLYYTCAFFKLVAIAARDLTRANNFAEKFGFKRAYGSYDDLANDPDVGTFIFLGSYIRLICKALITSTCNLLQMKTPSVL